MGTLPSKIKTTLIITTYNRADALELVLKSVMMQTAYPDEIIIADDGSTDETRSLVEEYAHLIPVQVIHCRHEDKGFRLSAIRNKAIALSKGDYLIMIDGDMILHPSFVDDHIRLASDNHFIQGSRVLLSMPTTSRSLQQKNVKFTPFSNGITNRLNACHSVFLSDIVSPAYGCKDYRGVRGCNMSFWKEDLLKVNGFDEDFVGWGREDSEFVVRMLNNGIVRKNVKFSCVAYHLGHPENKHSDKQLFENQHILDDAIQNKKQRCRNGIIKDC